MRAPQLVSDFFDWRWAPCVGLTAGSLAFIVLALLLIPTRIDGPTPGNDSLSSLGRAGRSAPQALFGASLAQAIPGAGERTSEPSNFARTARAPAPPPDQPAAATQRGFSPVIDRPEPPPPPPVVETAPPPPAPESGAVIIQQPEPDGPRREVTVP